MKLKSLKLNSLSMGRMPNQKMNMLRGGADCICGCRYANQGGSSNANNGGANNAYGYYSPGGGSWYP